MLQTVFYWFFTEFYWAFLGFTEFYWVFLGFTEFYRVFFCYHLQEDGTAYNASFLSTWLVTTWTLLFLPLYAAGRLLLAAAGVGGVASGAAGGGVAVSSHRRLVADIRDSAVAFRDKGYTLGETGVDFFSINNQPLHQ